MIPLVDVSPYSTMQDVASEPFKSFGGIGLNGPAEMSELRGVDAGESNVDLRNVLAL